MADERNKASWWQSAPGLMTATAGVIAAITGLIGGLNQIGMFDRWKQPPAGGDCIPPRPPRFRGWHQPANRDAARPTPRGRAHPRPKYDEIARWPAALPLPARERQPHRPLLHTADMGSCTAKYAHYSATPARAPKPLHQRPPGPTPPPLTGRSHSLNRHRSRLGFSR